MSISIVVKMVSLTSVRSVIIYRLCFLFTVLTFSSKFSVVFSKDVKANDTKRLDHVNLRTDNPSIISLKNVRTDQNKSNLYAVNDEVIENMDILLPFCTKPLIITDIPSKIYFIVTEVHAYSSEVTLGYQKDKSDPHSYVTGKNVGLVNMTEGNVQNVTLYLENNSAWNVTVLIAINAYNKSAPIPGGCNMEFQTEIAPYLLLNYTDSIVTVLGQPAAAPPSFVNKRKSCQIPPGTLLFYDMYIMYLPEGDYTEETYFESIKSMISVDGIVQNGKKVSKNLIGPVNKRLFSAYPGTGTIYAFVVYTSSSSSSNNNENVFSSAAYVPAMTYACSPELSHNTCQAFQSDYFELIFICILILGIFLTLLGHLYFRMEMFIYGAFTFGVITNILLINLGNFTPLVNAGFSVLSSVIGGLVWLNVWCYFGVPILSILLPLSNAGFLVSSVIFYFFSGSDGVQPILQSDTNFWLALMCGSLSVTLILITKAQDASVLTNSFIGGFMIIMCLDYFINSNLKYLVINMYRRATIPEFTGAVIDPPFQIRDFALLIVWTILIIAGYFTQKTVLSGKPPFPPPNNNHRGGRLSYNRQEYKPIPTFLTAQSYCDEESDNDDQNEKTPILSGSSQGRN